MDGRVVRGGVVRRHERIQHVSANIPPSDHDRRPSSSQVRDKCIRRELAEVAPCHAARHN